MDTRIDFLYLSEADMIAAGVTDMRGCMDTMIEMYKLFVAGDYVMGGANHNSHGLMLDFPVTSAFPNMPVAGPDRRFAAMPSYLGGDFDVAGMKWYGSNTANRAKGLPRSIHVYVLSDKDTGAPLAIMSGNLLSAFRTGALPGVGAQYLAREDSTTAAVIGPGVMNRTALESMLLARPGINALKVMGRSKESLTAFLDFAKEKFPQLTTISAVDSVEEAVRDADVVAVATSAKAGIENYPYLKEAWIKPGAFISCAATVNFDQDFVVNRARNIADSRKLYEAHAEEIPSPAHEAVGILGILWNDFIWAGQMDRAIIGDLGEIVSGNEEGRRSEDEIILLATGGLPIQDAAWATKVYRNAMAHGIGQKLNLWEEPALL